MTGLDKILKEIQTEAENNARRIIFEAENTASSIINEANEKALQEIKALQEKTEKKEKEIAERAKSAGEKAVRQAVLLEKQQLIKETLAKANERLMSLPDKEYFAFLTKALEKFAHEEKGEIILSEKDKARLTPEFEAAFKAKGLTLSEKTVLNEGFILAYGDIEEKCTIDALFQAENDRLTDIVVKTVFN